jgi:hypothetical protein
MHRRKGHDPHRLKPAMRRPFSAFDRAPMLQLPLVGRSSRGTRQGRAATPSAAPPEATCNRLEDPFRDRSPTIARHERGCTIGFQLSAGLGAMLSGTSRYGAIVSAATMRSPARPPNPEVTVSLGDQSLWP